MPRNILNLSTYTVTRVEETQHDYHVYAEVVGAPERCPHCGGTGHVGFGHREQLVKDLPMHGKRVGVYVDTRRFRCRPCTKTFSETLPDVDEKRAMTRRLLNWIGQQSLRRTFSSIAEEVGITEGAIRHVFRDYVNELERTVRFETPQWMGIDEIHLIKPRGVIANIQSNTVVEILPDRNKKTVVSYLSRLDGRDRVQYVAMDMWTPYRDAVRLVLPQARIVIDKFHVVRMANDAMETVRKSLRASLSIKQRRGLMHDRFVLLKRHSELRDQERLLLSGWLSNYPELGLAYQLKEDLFDVYSATTLTEAQARLQAWRRAVTPEVASAFQPVVTALGNWEPEIMSYFTHPITNAYTESLNNLIRVMNRLGRGYSFEALRAKILFTEGVHKVKKPAFDRRSRNDLMVMEDTVMMYRSCRSTRTEDRDQNFGADISTLVRLIEDGQL
jgi:transposase